VTRGVASSAAIIVALASATTATMATRGLDGSDQSRVETSAKAVVAAAGRYVLRYEQDMAYVLAEERATQRVAKPSGGAIAMRRTTAEFFLTYLPNEGVWIAVRDVREVDGEPVDDPDDVRSLMQRAPLWRLASAISEKNSRFNIGDVRRTFNEPTFGLLVISPLHQRRFKFERVAVSRASSPVVTLKFTERDRPTLINGTSGEPVFIRGEIDIDAATGRVERTRVEMTLGSVRAALATAYAPDAKLNLWVPAVMSERYEQTAGALRQTISVETDYSNYRRFDTSVIIK
jgi:hypothetical protein